MAHGLDTWPLLTTGRNRCGGDAAGPGERVPRDQLHDDREAAYRGMDRPSVHPACMSHDSTAE